MKWTLSALPILIVTPIFVLIGAYAWRRRSTPGAALFAAVALATAVWSFAHLMQTLSVGLQLKYLWHRVSYLGIAILPTATLCLVLLYTGHRKWMRPRGWSLLLIEPLITLILVWTNPLHGFVHPDLSMATRGSALVLQPGYGPWFWVHVFYSYVLVVFTTLILLVRVLSSPGAYRAQALAMLLGVSFPWGANLLALSQPGSLFGMNVVFIGFCLAQIAFAWGIFRYGLLDILPVARDRLVERMGNGVVVLDVAGQIVDLNPAARDILGDSAASLVGRPLVDVWPEWRELATLPDDAEVQREVHLGANGQQRFYELDVGPLYNNLIFAGRMLIFSDISERVRAEGALRRRMELQRLVASVATRFIHLGGHEPHQGIEYSLSTIGDSAGVDRCYLFQLTEDGHRVSNTHEWCAPGVEKQQDRLQDVPTARLPWWMAKLRRMEHIHVPDVEELPDVAANTRRLLEEQHIRSLLVVPVAVADKLIGFVGFDSVRQRREWTEEDINLLRMLAGLIGNALERQRAERALRQSQETTRALLNAPTQSALLVDREGTVLAANASPVYPSGRAGEELVGRSLWEVWPDELAHARKRYLSSTFDGGDPLRFEDAHGGHSFEHSLYPVADEGGNVSSVALLTRDVSERKRLEERLRQVQKMEAIGRLAGGVAHDFNNLLMVINGFADLLLDEADDEEPLRSEMEEIRQAGERAANLTRQLLAFSRRQVTKPREISLNQVIEGMLKMLNRLIDDHIALSYEPGASLGYIVADPGQIEQVLMNLAVNARDAINEAQRSDGRLVIRTWNVEAEAAERQETLGLEPGPYVALSVSDNGIGMGPEVQSHLFEPFFTTKEVGEGTGLGLAAVYGIVRGSGGGIEIDSEPGEGTTFTLYFPRVEEPAPCEALQAPAVAGGDETILVVEDSEDVLALTVRQLKGLGYHVLQAKSASEALTMVDGGEMPIDLVLTDVVMPEMSGRVLADRLRERLPDLAVVYMSGYPDKVMGRHGVLGADTHFVQKPFDQRAVAAEIRLALRTKAGVTCKQVGTGVRASGQG